MQPRPGPSRRTAHIAVAAIAALALLATAACSSSGASHRAGATRSASPTRASVSPGPTVSPRPTPSSSAKVPAVTPYTDVTGASMFRSSAVSLTALRKAYPRVIFSVHALRWDGVVRAYLAAAPAHASAHRTLPLFVVLSGHHSSSALESERTGLLPSVSQGKDVAIYPVGYHESWNVDPSHSCCHEAAQHRLDDAGFVAAATRDARTSLHADPDRSYLVGHSNGARLALTLACSRSSALYAAVATMAAVAPGRCAPAAPPVSVLVAVGSADTQLPSEEHSAPPVPQLDATAASLRRRDHCSSTSSTSRHGQATVTTWRGCRSGTAVRRIVYSGIRHSWPTSGHYPGATHVTGSTALGTLIEQFVAARHR